MGLIGKIFNLTNLTLVTALTLSTIAAWYSILGLTAIFAAAVIPIIIMGGALEVSKVVTTVWLHKYWHQVKWSMRFYLVLAVIALAFLTSMGIFGFLSKAHSDQSLVSGDSQAKLALFDEKIKTERDNIETARKALQQMDSQVDQLLSRGTTEQNAERAVQIRRQQAKERTALQNDIAKSQDTIKKLNEERAPIAAENRKVEAEVGPIKYIAALIYGDNPEANLLERAVRWVIILIVLVFDPLALTLVLAANSSRHWDKNKPIEKSHTLIVEPPEESKFEEETIAEEAPAQEEAVKPEEPIEQTYLTKPWVDKVPGISVPHQVYKPEPKPQTYHVKTFYDEKIDKVNYNPLKNNIPEQKLPEDPIVQPEIITENVTKEKPYKELEGGYVHFEDKQIHKDALKSLRPDLFRLTADSTMPSTSNFGTKFPSIASKGDIFVRVDILPNRVYKFDGAKWIEINKAVSDTYLHDQQYIKYLIGKIEKGEYDVELLSENEKAQIEQYLKNQNT